MAFFLGNCTWDSLPSRRLWRELAALTDGEETRGRREGGEGRIRSLIVQNIMAYHWKLRWTKHFLPAWCHPRCFHTRHSSDPPSSCARVTWEPGEQRQEGGPDGSPGKHLEISQLVGRTRHLQGSLIFSSRQCLGILVAPTNPWGFLSLSLSLKNYKVSSLWDLQCRQVYEEQRMGTTVLGRKREKWLIVAFANFCGINTSTEANPKLWLWHVAIKLCPILVIPWTVALQAPLSIGFPRQEYWSGLLLPSPEYLSPVSLPPFGSFELWLSTFMIYLFEYLFLILLGIYEDVELLGQVVVLCLTFWRVAKLFSTVVASFYILTRAKIFPHPQQHVTFIIIITMC